MAESVSLALLGSNFSGRSRWLTDHGAYGTWPRFSTIGPHPETACTGLAWTVNEELQLAQMVTSRPDTEVANICMDFEIGPLRGRSLVNLSGGEAVRVALTSALIAGATELHFDLSMEQLDGDWREIILDNLVSKRRWGTTKIVVVDNRLSSAELKRFDRSLTLSRDQQFGLDPRACFRAGVDVPSTPILLRNVSFSYPKTSSIFRGITLELRPGHLYILEGPNGSGKSTFMKLLSGTLMPQEGAIFAGGTNLIQGVVFVTEVSSFRIPTTNGQGR